MTTEQPTVLDALQACTQALEQAETRARAGDPTARLDALWAVVPGLAAILEQTIRYYDEKMAAVALMLIETASHIDAGENRGPDPR